MPREITEIVDGETLLTAMLEVVPECAGPVSELSLEFDNDGRTERFVDPYAVLRDAFAFPLYLPALRAAQPDPELLARCSELIEAGLQSPVLLVHQAMYFEALEPLMDGFDLLRAAIPCMGPTAYHQTVRMLKGVNADLDQLADVLRHGEDR
ncbi:hypothetical protein ACWCXH_39710 [Kitasatospora sp. NPDC001660]